MLSMGISSPGNGDVNPCPWMLWPWQKSQGHLPWYTMQYRIVTWIEFEHFSRWVLVIVRGMAGLLIYFIAVVTAAVAWNSLLAKMTQNWKSSLTLAFKQNFSCLIWFSVLWRCWFGGRKGIQPVKNPAGTQHSPMLRQKAECFFWYRPTQVVPEQRTLSRHQVHGGRRL